MATYSRRPGLPETNQDRPQVLLLPRVRGSTLDQLASRPRRHRRDAYARRGEEGKCDLLKKEAPRPWRRRAARTQDNTTGPLRIAPNPAQCNPIAAARRIADSCL